MARPLTYSDPISWLQTVWEAVHVCDDYVSGWGDAEPPVDMNDVKTAMAWIAEELGVDTSPDSPLYDY
jgi:hypothetical protein